MIRFNTDDYSTILIKYIALAGEFPWYSLYLIPGNHAIILRTLKKMKSLGYITTKDTGKQKTIRLTKKALPVLKKVAPDGYEFYMQITENHHFRGGSVTGDKSGLLQQIRRHRLSEIYCLIKRLEFNYSLNDKSLLSVNPSKKTLIDNTPVFYSAKEIKNVDDLQKHKIEFTRFHGTLISLGGIYNIYNLGDGLIKWNQYGENKSQVAVEEIINKNFVNKNSSTINKLSHCIIMGRNANVAVRLLNAVSYRKSEDGYELISFDNTYESMFFVPLSVDGALQLKILTSDRYKEKLMSYGLREFPNYNENKISSIDCELVSENNYILIFLDADLNKLKRFKNAMFLYPDKNFSVLCFSWQKEIIQQYIGQKITVIEVNPHKLFEEFRT